MEQNEEKKPQEVFSEGIFGVLHPLLREYDIRMKNIQLSQSELSDRIHKLTTNIQKCQKESEFVQIKPYLNKLANSKKNIQYVSTTLIKISERLNRLNRMAKQKYPAIYQQFLHQQQMKAQKEKESKEASKEGETTNIPAPKVEKEEEEKKEEGEVEEGEVEEEKVEKKEEEKVEKEEEQKEEKKEEVSDGGVNEEKVSKDE